MKQLKQQFVDSWHELRKTKVMAVAAMLIAIGVILGFFSVQLTEFIRIGFSGIPNELASMLFGPARYLVADDPVWKRISGNPSGEIYKTGSFRSD